MVHKQCSDMFELNFKLLFKMIIVIIMKAILTRNIEVAKNL